MFEDVIDRIYEAAVIPELWTDILDRLAAIAGCDGGIMISVDTQQCVRAVSSDCLTTMTNVFINEGWMRQNIRASRASALNHSGFVTDEDIVTHHEAETDPFYVEVLRKHGGGLGTGTLIPAPTGDLIIFNIEKSYKKGPVERERLPSLDALRPHLGRSALLAVRLGMERARAMTETLSKLGLGGAVLGGSGRVLSVNSLLEKLNKQFTSAAGGRLAILHRQAQGMLQTALADFNRNSQNSQTCSIPVPAVDEAAPCVAHLIPVRRQARDILTGASALIVVTSLAPPKAPPAAVLHGLFDLSPAEARVACALIQGQSVEEIAAINVLSRETIRAQLKSVLAKTGTKRQAELVGLLTGIQIGRDQDTEI
jgi:DNA-binding CsgD family transcriptional regulator